eukprot:300389-Rhodomonas_salina.1
MPAQVAYAAIVAPTKYSWRPVGPALTYAVPMPYESTFGTYFCGPIFVLSNRDYYFVFPSGTNSQPLRPNKSHFSGFPPRLRSFVFGLHVSSRAALHLRYRTACENKSTPGMDLILPGARRSELQAAGHY